VDNIVPTIIIHGPARSLRVIIYARAKSRKFSGWKQRKARDTAFFAWGTSAVPWEQVYGEHTGPLAI